MALAFTGAVACGQSNQAKPIDFNANGFEGFESTQLGLLASVCSFDGTTGDMTVTLGENETGYLFKRASDGMVVANAAQTGGDECAIEATKLAGAYVAKTTGLKIFVRGLGTSETPIGGQKLIIDYMNGIFGVAAAASTFPATDKAAIQVNLGVGTGHQVKFRGTGNADNFLLGTTSGVSYVGIATGATTTAVVAARAMQDVSIQNVTDIVVSAGPGNDVISGLGLAATATAAPNALAGTISLTVYGGDDNDTLTSGAPTTGEAANTLNGNDGNDRFAQQAGCAKDLISGDNGIDVVDYSSRASGVNVTLASAVVPAVAATGSITCVAASSIVNNQTFTLDDGDGHIKVFEFEASVTDPAYEATGTAIQLDVIGMSDTQVATYVQTQIVNNIGDVTITAGTVAGTVIPLTFNSVGVAGNDASVVKSDGAAFLVSGMFLGGSDVGAIPENDGGPTCAGGGEKDSINGTVEHVVGSNYADTLDASLATGISHILVGLGGVDTLTGSDASDYLFGGVGNDTLNGGGGVAKDYLYAGDGNDSLISSKNADHVIDGGNINCPVAATVFANYASNPYAIATTCTAATATSFGVDTLDFSNRLVGEPVSCNLSLAAGAEVVCGIAGQKIQYANIRNLRGGAGNDILTGSNLDNAIWGGLGDDSIYGMGGNDTLYGDAGGDTIYGGNVGGTLISVSPATNPVTYYSENDYISGGAGTNLLYGGLGSDLIDSANALDTVDCGGQQADLAVLASGGSSVHCNGAP